MKSSLKPIPIEQKPLAWDLLQSYLKELSQYTHIEISESGEFVYKYFDRYWQSENRKPYFLMVDELVAGFTFVMLSDPESKEDNIHTITEFYIKDDFRGKGLGSQFAKLIFDMLPGKWVIRQLTENIAAQNFWKKVISKYTNDNFVEVSREKGPEIVFTV